MLSLFPALLTYSLFAALILRLALGAFMLAYGVRILRKQGLSPLSKMFAGLAVLSALFLIVGLYTQGAALFTCTLFLLQSMFPSVGAPIRPEERMLVTSMCLSLLFLGAGAFALDLPL